MQIVIENALHVNVTFTRDDVMRILMDAAEKKDDRLKARLKYEMHTQRDVDGDIGVITLEAVCALKKGQM